MVVSWVPQFLWEPLLGEIAAAQDTRMAFLTPPTAQSPVLCRNDCTQRPWPPSRIIPDTNPHTPPNVKTATPVTKGASCHGERPILKLSKVYLKGYLRVVKSHPFWH